MNDKSSSGGIGILGCLQIIFIVLKLTGLINWTWAQVFIPFFISLGILVIVFIWLVYLEYKWRK